MTANIALRVATAEDAPRVAEVLLTSRKTFLPYAPLAHADADVHRWVRDVLIPSQGVTVALVDALIVGVLATSREAHVSWIDQLYLLPDHVGRGIGARLLVTALETLPSPVRLYTFQANQRARSFYERHGFTAIAFTDGQSNEERCPDVLYELQDSHQRTKRFDTDAVARAIEADAGEALPDLRQALTEAQRASATRCRRASWRPDAREGTPRPWHHHNERCVGAGK